MPYNTVLSAMKINALASWIITCLLDTLGIYSIIPLISFTYMFATAAAAKLLQSYLTLCDPIDGSPPGSAVPGILQARTLSGLPCPSPMHESEK